MEKTGIVDSPAHRVIPTFCHGCGASKTRCGILCHVVDGKFVRTEGNPDAFNNGGYRSTTLCAKGYTGPQYMYAPNRLQYPMKRTGEKGEGKFARISWDEALETIASKLKETRAKYGAESYAALSPEMWPVMATVGRRFLNVHGSPNYLHSAICATPRAAATKITIGVGNTSNDGYRDTSLIVNWGANTENSGVNAGEPRAIIDALERGAKLIDIRPTLEPMGARADMWLPVRPGTDCALALAMLNVIIRERLYDNDFVDRWCLGFDRLANHVLQYPPEWAEPITGIPAGKIKDAARTIATVKPAFIKMGNGVGDQANDGTSTVRAICLITAITGNLDIPGGNYGGMPEPGPGLIPVNKISTLAEKAPPDFVNRLVAPESPVWYQSMGMWDSGPTGAYYKGLLSVLTGKPYPVRVLNASCTNPLSATRNPKKVAEALRKVEFFFVMDVYHAPHVDFADIVLPACTDYERSDQIGIKNVEEGTWLGIFNKIAEPLGESRSPWQIYLDLAVKTGYGEDFWNGDMEACLKEQLAPSGISPEELRNSPRGVFVKRAQPAPPRKYRRYETLFNNLPHGKVQCYNELIGGKPDNLGDGVLPFLPEYEGPPEGIAETPELAQEYPLILSDVHAHRFSHHSYLEDIPYLRELKPYPWVMMNPATAEKYDIGNGDWVKVESPYGWSKFKAEVFGGIAPEVLMTKRGWWQSCEELNLPGYCRFDGGSEVNNLYNTDVELFDRFYSQMAKQTLVKVSKLPGRDDE